MTPQTQAELVRLLAQNEYDVVCFQELKASQTGDVGFDGYMQYKRMRTQARDKGAKTSGGGIATYVRTTRTSKLLYTSPESSVTERLDVEVEDVRFCNVYRPSAVGLHKDDKRVDDFNVNELPTKGKVVIAGDVNAHHRSWDTHCAAEDALGKKIYLWTRMHDFSIANDPKKATRLHLEQRTSLDIVLTSEKVAVRGWTTVPKAISDHVPIEFSILRPEEETQCEAATEQRQRTTWNWKEADWARFSTMLEASTAKTTKRTDPNETYSRWLGMVNKAAEECIPTQRKNRKRRKWFTSAPCFWELVLIDTCTAGIPLSPTHVWPVCGVVLQVHEDRVWW